MYRREEPGWKKHLDFILLDLLCFELAFIIACFGRHGFEIIHYESYHHLNFVLILLHFLVAILNESFKNVLKRGYYVEFLAVLKHAFILFSLSVVYLFSLQASAVYSRLILFITFLIYVFLAYFVRLFWKRKLRKDYSGNVKDSKRSVWVIALKDNVQEVVEELLTNNYYRYFVSGICVLDDESKTEIMGVKVYPADTIVENTVHSWVDEILIACPENEQIVQLMNQFIEMGITVHLQFAHVRPVHDKKMFVERIGNFTVLTTSVNTISYSDYFMKRSMDLIGAVVGCLLTLVLIIIVGPLIYMQSPGPIFYVQQRVGTNGKKFNLYKFRSMVMNADEMKKELMSQNRMNDELMFKMENDPRIIGGKHGIGQFIRKTSIDEFPQFFNVLKGDMSLVGTRPPTVDEWEKYSLHHRKRLAVKPGITGLWQISGRSDIVDFDEVVKLDTEYIANWTLGLDVKILLQTVLVVFMKKGSM